MAHKAIVVAVVLLIGISIFAAEAGLVGTWEYGPTEAVAVKDSTAYISSGSYLWVLDISDETSPALLEEIKLDNYIYALRRIGNYLYVCKNDSMLLIYDIHDERNITLGNSIKNYFKHGCNDVYVNNDKVYLCIRDEAGEQYALSDTLNPVFERYFGYLDKVGIYGSDACAISDEMIKSYDLTRSGDLWSSNDNIILLEKPRGIAVRGDNAYVGYGSRGIGVVDIGDINNLVERKNYPTGGYTYDVEVLDDTLVVTANGLSGVGIYKIVDDTTFNPVGACGVRGYAYELEVVGDRVYVGSRSGGLSIVDISDRTSPVVVGDYDGYSEMRGFCIEGDRLYAAGGEGGLNIYDISNRQDVHFISKTYGRFISEDVKVEGNYAYIAEADSGLTIMDISDENNPYVVGSTVTSYYGRTVDVSGDVCACGGRVDDMSSGGISLVDVVSKTTPTEKSVIASGYKSLGFKTEDTLLMLEGIYNWDGNFEMWSISDVLNPYLLDSVINSSNFSDFTTNDTLAFLTVSYEDSIYSYDISDPSNIGSITASKIDKFPYRFSCMHEYIIAIDEDSLHLWDFSSISSPVKVYEEPRVDLTTEIENDGLKHIYISAGYESTGYIDRGRYGLKIYAVDVSMPTSFTITEPQSGDTVSQDSMRVTWHKSTSEIGIDNYEVYINGIKSTESPDTTVSIVNGLGGTMEIWVEALDKIGNRARSDSVVVEDYAGIGRKERKETKGIKVISSIKGLVIRNEGTGVGEYRISDITGRVVKDGEIGSGMSIRVDIKSGIYFVRGEGNKESEKVLIIR